MPTLITPKASAALPGNPAIPFFIDGFDVFDRPLSVFNGHKIEHFVNVIRMGGLRFLKFGRQVLDGLGIGTGVSDDLGKNGLLLGAIAEF
jgi:hypothetical protein